MKHFKLLIIRSGSKFNFARCFDNDTLLKSRGKLSLETVKMCRTACFGGYVRIVPFSHGFYAGFGALELWAFEGKGSLKT